jgi:hypothetical protein
MSQEPLTLGPLRASALDPRAGWAMALVLGVLIGEAALLTAGGSVSRGGVKDFLVMDLGTRVALGGHNPYETTALQAPFAAHARREGQPAPGEEAGFFYPPQALLLFAPFALLPWAVAKWAWIGFLTMLGVACAPLAWTFRGKADAHALAGAVVVAGLLLNPVTPGVLAVGQTALILCASVALGEWAFERGWNVAGVVVWSLVAIKPHLGLPLLVLAGVVGGWRRFLAVGAMVAALNLLGALITTGSPATLLDYLRYLQGSHLSVSYNQVENDQIVSWNRVAYLLGGPRIDLKAATILAGFAVWGGLLVVRAWLDRPERWSPALALAGAATGALLCTQAHGYDLVLLVLLVPHMLWLWERGHRRDAAFLALLLALAVVPRALVLALAARLGLGSGGLECVLSYRALVVAGLAIYLLARGQPKLRVPTPAVVLAPS